MFSQFLPVTSSWVSLRCGFMKREIEKGIRIKNFNKKGFVFTLLALVVISYMIIEFNIYLRAYQLRQESEPSRMRALIIDEFATKVSQEDVKEVSEIIAYNAIYTLTNYSVSNNKYIDNVEDAIINLTVNGSANGGWGSLSMPKSQTLSNWSAGMKDLAEKMGFELTTEFSQFTVDQPDPWTVRINYTYSYMLVDTVSDTRINASTTNISVNVSVVGFPDPYLKKELGIERNILPAPLAIKNNLVSIISDGEMYGRGWFYGEVFQGKCMNKKELDEMASNNDPTLYDVNNSKRILCVKELSAAESYSSLFGSVIIFDPLTTFDEDKFDKIAVPFIAKQDNAPSRLTSIDNVLIKSTRDDKVTYEKENRIYDIENLRKAVLCGYYFNTASAQSGGYSFLGRLSGIKSQSKNNLETFVIGSWTPNSKNTNKNYSSIDWAYSTHIPGNKTIGMPGCKWLEMCNATYADMRFRIDNLYNHIAVYNMTELVCGDRCGEN